MPAASVPSFFACKKSFRMIAVRKRLATDMGQMRLFEEYRYFFYITDDRNISAEEVVFSANDRFNQEKLIAQLKSGVHALTTPVDNLVSKWAYRVMASLAWSLKAWSALLVPVSPRHEAKHDAEKRTLLRMESRHIARLSSRCRVRSCGLEDGWFTGCCPGTRGKTLSYDRSSGCTSARCAERRVTEVGVRMLRSLKSVEQRKGSDA